MADFSALKTAIQANIRTNGNEEITGVILQDILLSMVSTMGDGAINALAEALQAEITNRQNAVSGEATTRAEADSQLSGRINAEATARGEADTQLGNSITAITTRLNEGYVYTGIATPSTNPGTPAGKVFYIALQAGTYTNFSSLAVTQGITILKYNGTAWLQEQLAGIDDVPTAGSDNLIISDSVAAIRDLLIGNYKTEITLTANSGYIRYNGNYSSNAIGFYSNPIALEKGEIIIFYLASAYTFSALSEYTDGAYTPIIIGKTGPNRFCTYTFIADKDMQVVISGYSANFSDSKCYKLLYSDYTIIKNIMDVLDQVPKASGYVTEATGDFADIHTFPINTFYQCTNSAVYSQIANRPEGIRGGFGVYTFAASTGNVKLQILQSGGNALYISLFWGLEGWSNWKNITDDSSMVKTIGSINNSIVAAFDNIVSVGDSLTRSTVYISDTSPKTRQAYNPWPKVVKKVCGLDEYSIFAISGATSKTIWNEYKDQFTVPQTGKTLCTIYLGTNNWFEDTIETSAPESEVENYRTAWADDYTGCMCKIIQTFINFGAKIILIRPHAGGIYPASEIPVGWTLADTNEVIRKMALRFNIPYIDSADFNPTDIKYHYWPDLTGSNGLHLNDLGYACFAGKFIEEVNKLDTDMMKLLIPD